MNEKPILFKGAMVQAIMAGTKWQTRRIIKPQPIATANVMIYSERGQCWWAGKEKKFPDVVKGNTSISNITSTENVGGALWKCPHGAVGTNLWVRETFARVHEGLLQHLDPEPDSPYWEAVYRADGAVSDEHLNKDYGLPWTPSIFMPRYYSRINLEITNVRVERISDISEEDAKAEGVEWLKCEGWKNYTVKDGRVTTAVASFQTLWNSINGQPKPVMDDEDKISHYVSFPFSGEPRTEKYRGKDHIITPNPWTWCLSFKRV